MGDPPSVEEWEVENYLGYLRDNGVTEAFKSVHLKG